MSKSAIMASALVAMPSAAARERACSWPISESLSKARKKAWMRRAHGEGSAVARLRSRQQVQAEVGAEGCLVRHG